MMPAPWAVELVLPRPPQTIDWPAQFTPERIARWLDFGRGGWRWSGVEFLDVGFGRRELWVQGPHKLGQGRWMPFHAVVRFGPNNTARIRAHNHWGEVSREVAFRPKGNAPRALNKILREMRAELALRWFPR